MANQYPLSSSRAGLRSGITTRGATDLTSYFVPDVGVASPNIARGAGAMDGVASVAAVGQLVAYGVVNMDGHADMLGTSAVIAQGAANMDGYADMTADGTEVASATGHLDGFADVIGASASLGRRGGQMDGVASVIAISVEGATVGQMDGASSFDATAPHYFNTYLQDGVIGGQTATPKLTYHVALSQDVVSRDVMKPKVRYHLVSSTALNLSSTISFKMKFIKVIRDVTITMTPSLEPHSLFHYDLTSPIGVQSKLTPKFRAVLSLIQNLQAGQATSPKFIWGRVLTDALKVSAPLDATTHYWTSLAQRFKFTEFESFKLRHPVVLDQEIDLSLSLTGGLSLKLLQKLLVAAAPLPGIAYHLGLTGQVRVADIVDKLYFAILEQLFTAHDTPTHAFTAIGSLNQLLTIHPAFNNKLILKIDGHIQVSPEQLVSMLYRGDPLLDEVVITALYVSPSGTTTTWVVNTRTNAVTEYDNYNFQSFAQMGNRYIAAGAEGLYELDGDTDDGASIISRMMGGYLQLNEKKMFGIKAAYVAIRGGGRFYLRLISGDGREYTYELKAQPNLMTTKVKVGKGIRTTYMAFELVTEGQDFDLDSIEFIPMTSGRRV